ncbi:D-glycero-beta-D-manno-heptose-7-phosphate kinase [Mucilaginibacter sp. RS28]|uniref:D-glycero-beta-D-manno-heptose-7-phosphate kinase n=1 Tax=Mucilaginibacter straminoryzae TaxID=2932774 RepID=A0A9X1X2B7_9SPHI|nr:D-glycero-beta-D-manno-heptose-7-phosphate kinase [Mucilaginibacter straminoryzae]MCJ8209932.1 D-glycero-beta-D-manno-heptose-7-phosphate kinase [Mucilaginibacter straminoryzae]
MYTDLLKKLNDIKVLLIGDLMIDHYVWGKFERISPEAPVPLIDVIRDEEMLGGAGNVLKNLASFGVQANMVSVVGDDRCGDELCQLLQDSGADTTGIFRQPGRITTKKSRILASNHQMIRIDSETRKPVDSQSEYQLVNFVEQHLGDYHILLISDYAKGVLTENVLRRVIELANQKGILSIVDPKGTDFSKYLGASVIKPNKKEAAIATRVDITDRASLEQAADKLKQLINAKTVIITLSEEGMAIYNDHLEVIPTKASEVFDVTGAGDTVLAGIGICLAAGLSVKEACTFANHAAAIVVSKIGSAVTTVDEVLERMK